VTTLALFLALSAPLPQIYPVKWVEQSYEPLVNYWSDAYLVPRFLSRSNIREESEFKHTAVSQKGAEGLTQLMPAWQSELVWFARATDPGTMFDPFDPYDSIRVGTNYLYRLHRKFGDWRMAIGASNCGPGRFDQWLKKKRPLPAETVKHMKKVMG